MLVGRDRTPNDLGRDVDPVSKAAAVAEAAQVDLPASRCVQEGVVTGARPVRLTSDLPGCVDCTCYTITVAIECAQVGHPDPRRVQERTLRARACVPVTDNLPEVVDASSNAIDAA